MKELSVGWLEPHGGGDGVEDDVYELQHVVLQQLRAAQPALQRHQHARHVHEPAHLPHFKTTNIDTNIILKTYKLTALCLELLESLESLLVGKLSILFS